tara:strand:- start:36 stop:260 length:225 start_codon:yes stop_codon:yes gene_type:complete
MYYAIKILDKKYDTLKAKRTARAEQVAGLLVAYHSGKSGLNMHRIEELEFEYNYFTSQMNSIEEALILIRKTEA